MRKENTGGLDFDAQLFKSTFAIAACTALIGILLPMAFSFAILSGAYSYPQLQAFIVVSQLLSLFVRS